MVKYKGIYWKYCSYGQECHRGNECFHMVRTFFHCTMEDGISGRGSPVSYTHLDVYKRQLIGKMMISSSKWMSKSRNTGKIVRLMRLSMLSLFKRTLKVSLMFFSPCAAKFLSCCIASVSYTHLDVYKRQTFFSLPLRDIKGVCISLLISDAFFSYNWNM